jgi:hypothetical protein
MGILAIYPASKPIVGEIMFRMKLETFEFKIPNIKKSISSSY